MSLRFIGYVRVSTEKQTDNTSIEGQKATIMEFVEEKGGIVLDFFIESDSGGEDERVVLAKAIKACQDLNATLIVAKLDRLSRRQEFIAGFTSRFGIEYIAIDIPEAQNKYMTQIMGVFAEMERDMISERTREALKVKRAEGKFNPRGENLIGVIRNPSAGQLGKHEKDKKFRHNIFKEMERICIMNENITKKQMVIKLNERHNKTRTGKAWSESTLRNFLNKGKETGEISQYKISIKQEGEFMLNSTEREEIRKKNEMEMKLAEEKLKVRDEYFKEKKSKVIENKLKKVQK